MHAKPAISFPFQLGPSFAEPDVSIRVCCPAHALRLTWACFAAPAIAITVILSAAAALGCFVMDSGECAHDIRAERAWTSYLEMRKILGNRKCA